MDTTTTHNINVTFERDATSQFSFDPPGEIGISTALGEVQFTLLRRVASDARFPSNPIQWVNREKHPIGQPPGTTVTRTLGTASVSVDGAQAPRRLSFFLIIQTTDGKFFGSDPTIINMSPTTSSGGGSGR